MPHRNHRVIVVTPAGRQRYLEILIPQVMRLVNMGIVDEYHLWVNTPIQSDIDYMASMENLYPNLKCVHLQNNVRSNGNYTIGSFFRDYIADDTVYVRFDDDIVFLDSPDNFKKFLDYRIDHPEFFLVYANILNNAVIAHIHQRHGVLNIDKGFSNYSCMDDCGWKCPHFAVELHRQVLDVLKKTKSLDTFHMPPWLLHFKERVSINCISWLGKEFRNTCGGIIGNDEEDELSCVIPKTKEKKNAIFGNFCVVHYAFYTQREVVDRTNYLQEYKECATLSYDM